MNYRYSDSVTVRYESCECTAGICRIYDAVQYSFVTCNRLQQEGQHQLTGQRATPISDGT